jgi:hypothetical protein
VVSSARRHFARYAPEMPAIIRVQLAELIDANRSAEPGFCKFNSGSPRWNSGRASPRGPGTFVSCRNALFSASAVIEVTFRTSLNLPDKVEVAETYDGIWQYL